MWYNVVMEGQEYLNQISMQTRSQKEPKKNRFFSSKIFMVSMIGLILLVVIIIIGAILGGLKTNEKELIYGLRLHIENTSSVVSEYQPSVNSSDLRSNSASLLSILSNTNRDLTTYLVDTYSYKAGSEDESLINDAKLNADGLRSVLFNARINGILDRIYASQVAYEVSMIMNEESKIYNKTSNDILKNILSSSYSSLENLYNEFKSFSEAK